jgi:hypothetical protein
MMAMNYPEHPTPKDKAHCVGFLKYLALVLPCAKCSEHFQSYIEQNLKQSDFKTTKSFSVWMYNFHEHVNRRLGKDGSMSIDDATKWYSMFKSSEPPAISNIHILAQK